MLYAQLDFLRIPVTVRGRRHGRRDDVALAEARLDVLRAADALEAPVDHDRQAGAERLTFLHTFGASIASHAAPGGPHVARSAFTKTVTIWG